MRVLLFGLVGLLFVFGIAGLDVLTWGVVGFWDYVLAALWEVFLVVGGFVLGYMVVRLRGDENRAG